MGLRFTGVLATESLFETPGAPQTHRPKRPDPRSDPNPDPSQTQTKGRGCHPRTRNQKFIKLWHARKPWNPFVKRTSLDSFWADRGFPLFWAQVCDPCRGAQLLLFASRLSQPRLKTEGCVRPPVFPRATRNSSKFWRVWKHGILL